MIASPPLKLDRSIEVPWNRFSQEVEMEEVAPTYSQQIACRVFEGETSLLDLFPAVDESLSGLTGVTAMVNPFFPSTA